MGRQPAIALPLSPATTLLWEEDTTAVLARVFAKSINASRLPIPDPTIVNGDPLLDPYYWNTRATISHIKTLSEDYELLFFNISAALGKI